MTVAKRYLTWLDLTEQLVSSPSAVFPRAQFTEVLAETFACIASWNWQKADGSFEFRMSHPIPGWPTPAEEECWRSRGAEVHPLLCWFKATADPRPMSLGRVPRSLVPPDGPGLIREWLKPVGLEQQLAIPYQLDLRESTSFVLAKSGDDFSADDLDLARRIQPLIAVVSRQTTALQRCVPTRPPERGLTGRELTVLQLLAEGKTAEAIAHRLGISPRTVHTHLARLYRKLRVCDRMRAVLAAQELGLLPAARTAAIR